MTTLNPIHNRTRSPQALSQQTNPVSALHSVAALNRLVTRLQRGESLESIAAEVGVTEKCLRDNIAAAGLSLEKRAGTARSRVRERK